MYAIGLLSLLILVLSCDSFLLQQPPTISSVALSYPSSRNSIQRSVSEVDGTEEDPMVEDALQEQPRRRKARGKNLRRDTAGIPTEQVYAPRKMRYPIKKSGVRGGSSRVRAQGEAREVGINNAQGLRIAGGSAKGRKLESPEVYLRPMMGKVKEALYSTLVGFGVFDDGAARVLDCFAGSGSVGLEALSRGARHATFVDMARVCCDVAERNAAMCAFKDTTTQAVCGDVLDVLRNPARYQLLDPYDVITLTPPYQEIVYADLIAAVSASDLVREDTIVVIEYPVELGCLPHVIGGGRMVGLRNRRYGRTVLGIYIVRPSGRLPGCDSRPEEFIKL
ncbi:unnamed protein product [Chrysoparadoxa australica]